MSESVMDEIILNERTRGLQGQLAYQDSRIKTYQKVLAEKESELEDLKKRKLNNTIQFYCLNCSYCRYSEIECTCTSQYRAKLYIRPDDKPCHHFLLKSKLIKDKSNERI